MNPSILTKSKALVLTLAVFSALSVFKSQNAQADGQTDNTIKIMSDLKLSLVANDSGTSIKINDNNHINDAINTFKQRAVDDQSAYVRLTAMKSLKEINNHRVLQFKNIADPVASENYKQEIATLQSALQQIIQAEKDDEVINQLKIQGLYIETVQ